MSKARSSPRGLWWKWLQSSRYPSECACSLTKENLCNAQHRNSTAPESLIRMNENGHSNVDDDDVWLFFSFFVLTCMLVICRLYVQCSSLGECTLWFKIMLSFHIGFFVLCTHTLDTTSIVVQNYFNQFDNMTLWLIWRKTNLLWVLHFCLIKKKNLLWTVRK